MPPSFGVALRDAEAGRPKAMLIFAECPCTSQRHTRKFRMKSKIHCLLALCVISGLAIPALADPLPSWSDREARTRIIDFVEAVSDPRSEDYITPAARIAVFDNDGTLWSEQPIYFQGLFAIDRLREMAHEDEAILSTDLLRAAVAGDLGVVAEAGHEGLLEILKVTHADTTVADFQGRVVEWMASATHPETGLLYRAMVFQPMLELLSYLRDNQFSTYIVSGGGLHFLRAVAEELYGVPPDQVIGSSGQTRYAEMEGTPQLVKDPAIAFIDDKAGKPVGIDTHIGKRPIFAAGNSDGDFEMLEYTMAGAGPRFGMIVHHSDAEREWAYDRDSPVGRLARGLDEGPGRGWLIVDMASDWERIWPAR